MTEIDYTQALKKIVPEISGPFPVRLRTGTIAAVNGNGTVNVTMADGQTLTNKPVVGTSVVFTPGQVVNVLVSKDQFLVLGPTASSGATSGFPSAFADFGTPSIANATVVDLTPTSVPVNVGGMWTSGTAFTIPTGQGGLYEMGIACRFVTNANGVRQGRISVNGAEYMYWTVPSNSIGQAPGAGVTRRVMVAGDVVRFNVYQNSGGALAFGSGTGWLERVR